MIYIDVSNLIINNFLTGIQRVVREVVVRMLQNSGQEIVLFSWSSQDEEFDIIDNNDFLKRFKKGQSLAASIRTRKKEYVDDIPAGSVFFDIDAVWNAPHQRKNIYPKLKNNGVKIAVYVYDIIPIIYPQFTDSNTLLKFMSYISAVLQYADMVFVSTKTTQDRLNGLSDQLNLPPVKCCVTWLGADFATSDDIDKSISKEVKDVVSRGKYILAVGTIEPRKNHKLLLDAYDAGLADLGINIVFAGRIGWKVEDIIARISSHPQKGTGVFLLEKQNNASIKYLYENAFIVAFPTFDEGFGLPLVEALQNNVVTLSSDAEVLKEVGGKYCDYFNPTDVDSFISLVKKYYTDQEEYKKQKELIKQYNPITWDYVADIITKTIGLNKTTTLQITLDVKQVFFLTARSKIILNTLTYYNKFMPFINEAVIVCPDETRDAIKNNYSGRIKLIFLTDNQLLENNPLPSDHITRNQLLRCLALQSGALDDAFIMSDDDYRPLKEVCLDDFINAGKYTAYYCGNLDSCVGGLSNKSSFDYGMIKTNKFLKENHYPYKMYASHMPQIIDKRIYLEMIKRHPEIVNQGFCEWSTYFNYGYYHYPDKFIIQRYKTLFWPNLWTDWKQEYIQSDFLFENYYEANYMRRKAFAKFSKTFSNNTTKENLLKEKGQAMLNKRILASRQSYNAFYKRYLKKYKEEPSFGLYYTKGEKKLFVPKYMEIKSKSLIYIPFNIKVDDSVTEKNIRIMLTFHDKNNVPLGGGFSPTYIPVAEKKCFLPITIPKVDNNLQLVISSWVGNEFLTAVVPIVLPRDDIWYRKIIIKYKWLCPVQMRKIIRRIIKKIKK